MNADHVVNINRLSEDQREEIRKRVKKIQREEQTRQSWISKDENDDSFNSKNWRECDIEHSFVQFDFNDFFDKIDHKRFFTCVYL